MFPSNGSFDDIVSRLQADDPRFSTRVDQIARRGHLGAARIGVLAGAWGLGTLFFLALAGWPGLLAAAMLGGLLFWLRRD